MACIWSWPIADLKLELKGITLRYISTRGQAPTLDFAQVTLAGLASDGGLYVPESWPQLSAQEIEGFAGRPYADVAAKVMAPFIGDAIPQADVEALARKAYGSFHHDAVVPLVQVDEKHFIMELFHGPTLAFKDVALQFLGQLFDYLLQKQDEGLTVVGATSGDTGSAAIHAVAGQGKSAIFMLHPHGRVSDVQRRQMTTVDGDNVFNIAVDGSFDDCQTMVKTLLRDDALAAKTNLSAVNSINWARVMAQVVYYFTAAVSLGAPHRRLSFSVPTGNFGDVFAGYVAMKMGLPVERLIVATNENDILHRALSQGDYSAKGVVPTITPSMDIQISSNFERLLFDLSGKDSEALTTMMTQFSQTGAMDIPAAWRAEAANIFTSKAISQGETSATMAWAQAHANMIIDPHTAVALAAAQVCAKDIDTPIVTLATAHAAKFPDAVKAATGVHPNLPAHSQDIFKKEERFERLPNDVDAVRQYILEHLV